VAKVGVIRSVSVCVLFVCARLYVQVCVRGMGGASVCEYVFVCVRLGLYVLICTFECSGMCIGILVQVCVGMREVASYITLYWRSTVRNSRI
jgi:hypothetical protein